MTSLTRWKGNGSRFPSFKTELPDLLDVDRFFDEPFMLPALWENRRWNNVPATNIRELDKEFVLELAVPGLDKKDFIVDVCEGNLEIKVEKEVETKKAEGSYTRREYDYHAFYRSFYLPETVNPDKIKAEYENGILMVHLPKKAAVAKKKAVKEIAVT